MVCGAEALARARQGSGRLRLGDYVEATGELAVVGAQRRACLQVGPSGVQPLQRFEEAHPGGHFELHKAAPWRNRRPAPAAAAAAEPVAVAAAAVRRPGVPLPPHEIHARASAQDTAIAQA